MRAGKGKLPEDWFQIFQQGNTPQKTSDFDLDFTLNWVYNNVGCVDFFKEIYLGAFAFLFYGEAQTPLSQVYPQALLQCLGENELCIVVSDHRKSRSLFSLRFGSHRPDRNHSRSNLVSSSLDLTWSPCKPPASYLPFALLPCYLFQTLSNLLIFLISSLLLG